MGTLVGEDVVFLIVDDVGGYVAPSDGVNIIRVPLTMLPGDADRIMWGAQESTMGGIMDRSRMNELIAVRDSVLFNAGRVVALESKTGKRDIKAPTLKEPKPKVRRLHKGLRP